MGVSDAERGNEHGDVQDRGHGEIDDPQPERVIRTDQSESRRTGDQRDVETQQGDEQQPAAEPGEERWTVLAFDVPDLCHRMLPRLGHSQRTPDQAEDADHQADTAQAQRVDVLRI